MNCSRRSIALSVLPINLLWQCHFRYLSGVFIPPFRLLRHIGACTNNSVNELVWLNICFGHFKTNSQNISLLGGSLEKWLLHDWKGCDNDCHNSWSKQSLRAPLDTLFLSLFTSFILWDITHVSLHMHVKSDDSIHNKNINDRSNWHGIIFDHMESWSQNDHKSLLIQKGQTGNLNL